MGMSHSLSFIEDKFKSRTHLNPEILDTSWIVVSFAVDQINMYIHAYFKSERQPDSIRGHVRLFQLAS